MFEIFFPDAFTNGANGKVCGISIGEEPMKATAAEQTGMKREDFEALFSKYRQAVYLAAKRVTGNTRDAEDALQSLFLKLIDQGFRADSVTDPAGCLYRAGGWRGFAERVDFVAAAHKKGHASAEAWPFLFETDQRRRTAGQKR